MSKIGIDMLDVGKGDSYVIDLRNEQNEKFVMVIDGGTMERSEVLVSHVNNFHDGSVNLAICTHPDTDHIAGLINLFQNCDIKHLFLNDPRDFIHEDKLIEEARNNLNSDEVELFKASLDRIDELKKEAVDQGTVHHASTFAGTEPRFVWGGWSVYVLGPSENLFRDLWLNEDIVKNWFNSDDIDKIVGLLPPNIVLDDPSVDTKPVNNSSIIILIEGFGHKYLFTGDSGKRALRDAIQVRDISNLTWLDVPHHGSRRNLDFDIINHLSPQLAYISSPGTKKHPRRNIIKAFQKTGTKVYSTCKHGHVYQNFNLPRDGWTSLEPWDSLS